jgi:streptogrisin C
MQRRTVVAIAATVTAAGAAVAFTLPSMAGTTPSGSKTTAATGTLAPQLLKTMKRDLGTTDAQATARVKRAKWAAGVATTLRTKAGAAYGGSWLTNGGMTLNIGITDAAMADAVTATGAVPKLVDHSAAQLDGAKKALDAAATKADRKLPGWYVDLAANKVAVQALPGDAAKAKKLAEAAGIPAAELKVVTVKSAPKPFADVIGGEAYFINLAEGTARCSVGFSVEGGFVTAGHCGKPGDQTFGADQQPSGEVAASVFPGDADFGFVKTNADFTPQPFVDDFAGNLLPVAGSTEAPVGAAVCRFGSTTGAHCGTILAKNQTVNYPEGSVTGLTQTDACAEGGDSGGSWLSGDQAQGVTSGGSGDCTVGGETFFQPVNEILQRNNLTLLTSTGGAGGAADPSAAPTEAAPTEAAPTEAAPTEGASAPPADQGTGNNNGGRRHHHRHRFLIFG